MIINAIKLRIVTAEGEYGFSFSFARKLTIIRAGNSSGKSTLFNSLLYGLGMEEIIGGKGERALNYAVKDYFDLEGKRLHVVASEVLVELSNTAGKVITLRRVIRDSVKDSSLIEIFFSSHLTKMERLGDATPTFISKVFSIAC